LALSVKISNAIVVYHVNKVIRQMNIAVVGCGYVADLYGKTLDQYPYLALVGAYDSNEHNLSAFCNRLSAKAYTDLQQMLSDSSVELVLNLTNPRSHYEVTKSCLEAGKHVYSEKPLAMELKEAEELVRLAESQKLYLGAAPCSLLGETAQTMWKALHEGVIGRVRLVYANFDDGMIAPNCAPWMWRNEDGVPWPAKDEFEVGCTYEHAGYVLTWLAAFFGPAKRVTAFASCQIPDKGIPVDVMAPDFSVGCIEYADGVVARVTCGLVAPKDKSLTIIGDNGVIFTRNVRNDTAPVYVRRLPPMGLSAAIERRLNSSQRWLDSKLPNIPWAGKEWGFQKKYPFARKPSGRQVDSQKPVDFCRGPSEIAEAIRYRRPCRLSADLGLHITELVEALQYPERFGGQRTIKSTFAPIQPLPWIE
jgi:predicted dehydrogenase